MSGAVTANGGIARLLLALGLASATGCGPGGAADDDATSGDDDATLPDDDSTPPDDDSTPPDDDSTPPDDDTTLPDDDTTLPDDDTTLPDDDSTPPDDDATLPDDDATPPDDDTTAPDDDTSPDDDDSAAVDADGDGYLPGEDCNDTDATVHPGAIETCDEVDQDCNGLADDGAEGAGVWYADGDGDGYGDAGAETWACAPPPATVDDATDCDDTNSLVHPSADDECNGIDDDCDGTDDCPLDGIFDLTFAEARIDSAAGLLGESMSAAGDVNGDGYGDVVLGVPRLGAYIFYGPIEGEMTVSAADVTLGGEVDLYDLDLGWAVAGGGDLNGDGYDDVVVTSPHFTDDGDGEGNAYVFYGPLSGVVPTDDADVWIYVHVAGSDLLGYDVAVADDVTGDGLDDVWISAPSAGEWGGYTLLYSGPFDGAVSQSDAIAAIEPGVAGINGELVAYVGDVSGDGIGDLMFSGYQSGVQLFDGSVTGLVTGDVAFSTLLPEPSPNLGSFPISAAGDVNGDGFADILVGDQTYSSAWDDQGAAYLFLGPITGTHNFADADTTLLGGGPNYSCGRSVAGAGDVDGDGYYDFLIAQPYQELGPGHYGAAYLVYGPGPSGTHPVSDADVRLDPPIEPVMGAWNLSGAGDLDADGYDDFMIMAAGYDGPFEASVFVVYGRPR